MKTKIWISIGISSIRILFKTYEDNGEITSESVVHTINCKYGKISKTAKDKAKILAFDTAVSSNSQLQTEFLYHH